MSVKFPLFDSEQSAYALCGLSTDITDRKQTEQELRRYNQELEQFAYIAAHDLQEPLRTVKSYAQLLTRRYQSLLDDQGHELLAYMISGVDRMGLLISDLQSYTEVAHAREPERLVCNLNEVARETIHSMGASIGEARAEVRFETLPTVIANPRQMGQVFQNLISNAIKYKKVHPPRIEIKAERKEHEWTVRVSDNGIGLDVKYSEQIFGLFKRLHGRDVPGTGLGLAICKQIVEQHGGRIWVESIPGEGASFFFTLPA